ncbi:MAG: hypothetical protein AAF170_02570 [Bacteroidota bacterium]
MRQLAECVPHGPPAWPGRAAPPGSTVIDNDGTLENLHALADGMVRQLVPNVDG